MTQAINHSKGSDSAENAHLRELVQSQADFIRDLKAEVSDLRPRVKGLQLTLDSKEATIERLESRLEQRTKITVSDYKSKIKYFKTMQDKVIEVFLAAPKKGLTNPEIQLHFSRKYPRLCVTYLPRRVTELVTAGKLYRHDDDDKTARYFLVLKPDDAQPDFSVRPLESETVQH